MASGEVSEATTIQFTQFDIVSDHSDHHYGNLNQSGKDKECFTNENSSVHRKIMKEWKILKKGLPETIYVRVYEKRIDLLRAVIVGASGTPYHDGLFFFDIAFPSDYPNKPPKVHYRSHGLRLNPNLYEGGYVCLSLINTWDGNMKERWDSCASTILQVLVSIQGLVLNDKPYFNEPGYGEDKYRQSKYWVGKSLAYNEDVFILSCKTMLYVLQKPPKNFGSFVAEHFHNQAQAILAALKAYRDGCVMVGHYTNDGSSSSSKVSVSTMFKANADKLYLDLKKAFDKISNSMAPEKVEKKKHEVKIKTILAAPKPQEIVKKPKSGILRKVVGVLKWIVE